MEKYRWLRERIAQRLPGISLREPQAADDGLLTLAHDAAYVRAVQTGSLPEKIQKDIGFPWTLQMVERSRRSVGATVDAVFAALEEGAAVNLAGGTHHAHAAWGSGFCVFNDIAVAARAAQAHWGRLGQKLPVAVIDLDVHQGDGTAEIVRDDPSVFTFSMQGRDNFPFQRAHSDLDIELDSRTGDTAYLAALRDGLAALEKRFSPALVIYVAGVDVHENDRLGKLALSTEGVRQRDQTVLAWCAERRLPVAMCMAGGYGRDLSAMVDIQVDCIGRLFEFQRQWRVATDAPVFE
jgi:acetoin utilization deacetylase AcuC-like enzyme